MCDLTIYESKSTKKLGANSYGQITSSFMRQINNDLKISQKYL
jgi:hypothetical protein